MDLSQTFGASNSLSAVFSNNGTNPDSWVAATASSQPPQSVMFIDGSIENYQLLLNGLADDPTVFFLDPSQDGITQITSVLQQYDNLDAVHVVSHGGPGSLTLGNRQLNAGTLAQYSQDLHSWGAALSETADFLFYGCHVAAGDVGAQFVDALSVHTGADIAASDDLTGNAWMGGDWALEHTTGAIEAGNAFHPAALQAFDGVLVDLASSQLSQIESGLQELVGFADRLEQFGELGQALPFVDQSH